MLLIDGFEVAPEDIASGWRTLASNTPAGYDEALLAEGLIEDAWDLILSRVPGVESRLVSEELRQSTVKRVIRWMVRRVLMNPDGIYQQSGDDYSEMRDKAISSGLLYLSPEEHADLSAGTPVVANGMYVIEMGLPHRGY